MGSHIRLPLGGLLTHINNSWNFHLAAAYALLKEKIISVDKRSQLGLLISDPLSIFHLSQTTPEWFQIENLFFKCVA